MVSVFVLVTVVVVVLLVVVMGVPSYLGSRMSENTCLHSLGCLYNSLISCLKPIFVTRNMFFTFETTVLLHVFLHFTFKVPIQRKLLCPEMLSSKEVGLP